MDNHPGVILYGNYSGALVPLKVGSDGTVVTSGGGGSGAGDALTTSPLSQFAATTSLQLKGVISDETGSGALVFATSPALVTPDIGTPSAGVATNLTGLPVSTGISGLASGIATFLGTPSSVNLAAALTDETGSGAAVFATSPTLVTPLLGTPTSGVATNLTGLPLTTGVTGTLPVANGGTGVTNSTGTVAVVLSTSPTLVTPVLGVASATSLSFGSSLLANDSANVLSQRNGTNGQTFNLYNTYTDGSNYERGLFQWSSNILLIGAGKAGTGSNRRVSFQNLGFEYFGLATTGNIELNSHLLGGTGALTTGRGTASATAPTSTIAQTVPSVSVIGASSVIATSGYLYGFTYQQTSAPTATSTLTVLPVYINPTINYSAATPGAGSYEALKIAVTETALPTGANYLIRASAGSGGTTDKFTVLNTGLTTWADAADLVFGTTTGTKIGTATTQKLAFYNATPVVQRADCAVNDGTLASVAAQANLLRTALRDLGLMA